MNELIFFGCSICSKNKAHRHCPKCSYEMDRESKTYNYGKYASESFTCLKCNNKINVISSFNEIRHEHKSFDVYLNERFLNQQREKNNIPALATCTS